MFDSIWNSVAYIAQGTLDNASYIATGTVENVTYVASGTIDNAVTAASLTGKVAMVYQWLAQGWLQWVASTRVHQGQRQSSIYLGNKLSYEFQVYRAHPRHTSAAKACQGTTEVNLKIRGFQNDKLQRFSLRELIFHQVRLIRYSICNTSSHPPRWTWLRLPQSTPTSLQGSSTSAQCRKLLQQSSETTVQMHPSGR